jgi:hypothetical protein
MCGGENNIKLDLTEMGGEDMAIEYVIRQISVGVLYKSGNVCGFTDGMNTVGRTLQTVLKI